MGKRPSEEKTIGRERSLGENSVVKKLAWREPSGENTYWGKDRGRKYRERKDLCGKNRGGEPVRKERGQSTSRNFGVVLTIMLLIDEYFGRATSIQLINL